MKKLSEKTTGIITALEYKQTYVKVIYALMMILMVVLCMICVFPPLWVAMSSFKDAQEFLQTPPTLFPKSFDVNKVIVAWKDLQFGRYYMNSLTILVGSVAVSVLFNGIAGFVLSRLKPVGTELLLMVMLWTVMMPATLNLVPLYSEFLDYGMLHLNLTESYWPIWLMSICAPMHILHFKNFFDRISSSYIEAAKVDGATNIGIFFKIIIPMSRPIVAVVALSTAIASWDNFLWPYILISNEELFPVSVKLFGMKMKYALDMQVIGAFFAILPPIIIFLIFQKQIMDTGTSAGVKE